LSRYCKGLFFNPFGIAGTKNLSQYFCRHSTENVEDPVFGYPLLILISIFIGKRIRD